MRSYFLIVKNQKETKMSLDLATRSLITASYSKHNQTRCFGNKMSVYQNWKIHFA